VVTSEVFASKLGPELVVVDEDKERAEGAEEKRRVHARIAKAKKAEEADALAAGRKHLDDLYEASRLKHDLSPEAWAEIRVLLQETPSFEVTSEFGNKFTVLPLPGHAQALMKVASTLVNNTMKEEYAESNRLLKETEEAKKAAFKEKVAERKEKGRPLISDGTGSRNGLDMTGQVLPFLRQVRAGEEAAAKEKGARADKVAESRLKGLGEARRKVMAGKDLCKPDMMELVRALASHHRTTKELPKGWSKNKAKVEEVLEPMAARYGGMDKFPWLALGLGAEEEVGQEGEGHDDNDDAEDSDEDDEDNDEDEEDVEDDENDEEGGNDDEEEEGEEGGGGGEDEDEDDFHPAAAARARRSHEFVPGDVVFLEDEDEDRRATVTSVRGDHHLQWVTVTFEDGSTEECRQRELSAAGDKCPKRGWTEVDAHDTPAPSANADSGKRPKRAAALRAPEAWGHCSA